MSVFALGEHRPEIHPDSWVAPDANVIGRVVLEEGASVWFGTTIRAEHETVRIGAGSNVQDNCVLHVDPGFGLTVGQGCTIGHKVILHGCTIGDNTLIGMGATILNGARIGSNCLIGGTHCGIARQLGAARQSRTRQPSRAIAGAVAVDSIEATRNAPTGARMPSAMRCGQAAAFRTVGTAGS